MHVLSRRPQLHDANLFLGRPGCRELRNDPRFLARMSLNDPRLFRLLDDKHPEAAAVRTFLLAVAKARVFPTSSAAATTTGSGSSSTVAHKLHGGRWRRGLELSEGILATDPRSKGTFSPDEGIAPTG